MPPGLYPDEAMNGNNALEAIATNNYKLFYPENNGREGLFINIQAISVYIFSNEPWALRSVSAIFGTLTVIGVYLLALELFRRGLAQTQNSKLKIQNNNLKFKNELQTINYKLQTKAIALLSAFFLATSFWHTNFSRIGFRAIMLPFLTTFSFYFLFKGFRRGKIFDFVWAGIFMGLGFHTYIAFRIVPFVVLAILIFKLIEMLKLIRSAHRNNNPEEQIHNKERLKEFLLHIFIYTLFVFLAALPMLYYFALHPADFIGRAGQVSVFASQNPFTEFIKSAWLTLAQFNFVGDWNWRHNYAGSPLLFWPVGIFFLIGIYVCIKNCLAYFRQFIQFYFPTSNFQLLTFNFQLQYPFLMLWFFAMLAPSILSTEGLPHALRSIGAIPPTFIIAGLGAFQIYNYFKNKIKYSNPKIITAFCFTILFAIAIAGYYKYFIAYANNPNVQGAFAANYVKIGRFINNLPKETKKYVIVNANGVKINGIPMPTQTIMFITDSYGKANQLEKNIFYLFTQNVDEHNFYQDKNYVIIPLEKNEELLKKLRSLAPGKIIKGEGFDYIIKN